MKKKKGLKIKRTWSSGPVPQPKKHKRLGGRNGKVRLGCAASSLALSVNKDKRTKKDKQKQTREISIKIFFGTIITKIRIEDQCLSFSWIFPLSL